MEGINVKDFGAMGDGVTNDTVAIQSALDAAILQKRSVFFPAGNYMTDTINVPNNWLNQFDIVGEGMTNTVLQKLTADGGDLFVLGSATQTTFLAGLKMSNLTFRGIIGNTGSAVKAYDCVRSSFSSCIMSDSIIGFNLLGGISLHLTDIITSDNQIGLNLDHFSSNAGGGWPNLIVCDHCMFVDNSKWGVNFVKGRMLKLNDCDIEGNGTSGDATTGAVSVSGVGSEGDLVNSIGLMANGCWFEANKGDASVVLSSGNNSLNECYFIANPQAIYDIHIKGGRYALKNCEGDTSKTYNVYEEAAILNGIMENSIFYNLHYNPIKTRVVTEDGQVITRGGEVPVITNMAKPLMQTGSASASSVQTVTFPTSFTSAPFVFCQIANDSSGTIEEVEIYNVTNTGFTVRKKSHSGTNTFTNINVWVNWFAIGSALI
jgi:hypothetical protein